MLKSELAAKYGITTKTLYNWVKTTKNQPLIELYKRNRTFLKPFCLGLLTAAFDSYDVV